MEEPRDPKNPSTLTHGELVEAIEATRKKLATMMRRADRILRRLDHLTREGAKRVRKGSGPR